MVNFLLQMYALQSINTETYLHITNYPPRLRFFKILKGGLSHPSPVSYILLHRFAIASCPLAALLGEKFVNVKN